MMIHHTKLGGLSEYHYLDGNHERLSVTSNKENKFDPRVRPWFINAENDGEIRLTEPYFFYFLKTTGVTLSRRSLDGNKVVGADFTLDSLSQQISEIGYSDNSKLILFDNNFTPLAQYQSDIDILQEKETLVPELESSLFQTVLNRVSSQTLYSTATNKHGEWSVTLTPVTLNKHVRLLLAEAILQDDLVSNLLSMRDRQVTVALVMMLISFLIVWFVAKKLANPLQKLVLLTDNIARFDFKKTRYPKSLIKEVANLTESIELMEHTLHDLLSLLRDTAENQEFSVLAKTITHQSYLVTRAETILLSVYSDQESLFTTAANHAIIPLRIDLNELLTSSAWLMSDLKKGELIHLNRSDNTLKPYSDILYNSDIYLFPLLNRKQQLVGILTLGYERPITQEQSDKHAFLRELLSFAEIAKENIDQMQQQKDMLNAFIELIASAIDTKSPYTGSHCQRIPELSKMLTEVADKDSTYFSQFEMTTTDWEALHLASWLHDCGKVTTPEYVIDKATKLETIYDRIHEIRMRFELLKTQAVADYWQAIAEGGDENTLKNELLEKHKQLDSDFAFVAECNIGGENLDDKHIQRLEQIGQTTWTRTLDDQIGISWIEKQRAEAPESLPAQEYLLANKTSHRIPWSDGAKPQDMWQEEYILQPGEVKYDRGELYNLSTKQGTLTAEERFIINDHIIQTHVMLNKLPYPEHLQKVPEIAGGHHERVDGNGYPRGLNTDQLSVPARIMAIADVFEALTSSDRPYKKAKSLEKSIHIMTHMATSGHIDPKLYILFLDHELYQTYADMFLDKEQHSVIDKQQHITQVKEYLKSLI